MIKDIFSSHFVLVPSEFRSKTRHLLQINIIFTCLFISLLSCNTSRKDLYSDSKYDFKVELVVLGVAQDAGAPQINCQKNCCKDRWNDPSQTFQVSCLGIVDQVNTQIYLFDATPDMPTQWESLRHHASWNTKQPDGVFLTHAHIGHYTGLMHLGREAQSANQVPVYAMPGMEHFLSTNGPWDQLIKLEQIVVKGLTEDSTWIGPGIRVKPVCVPHRDEYSETVGFLIEGPSKKALFIPDIDKWNKWERSITEYISQVDYAFLDATFYGQSELPGRNMSEIPHPFVVESMELFKDLSPEDKAKIYFIHLNHSNPLLLDDSPESKAVEDAGFHVARRNMSFGL